MKKKISKILHTWSILRISIQHSLASCCWYPPPSPRSAKRGNALWRTWRFCYFGWSSMNGFNCMASYIFHAENCCKNWPGAWWLGGSWNPCPWWHISLSRRRSVTRRQCRRQETQTLEAFIDENILDKKYLGILSGPAVTQEQFSGTEIDLLSQ